MAGQAQTLLQVVHKLWSAVAGRRAAPAPEPQVIVHDPAAQRAHDLDDPFFDDKVQTRIADVIAGARQKK